MKNQRLIFSCLVLLAFLLTGCEEKPIIIDPGKTMKDLVVPAGFTFNMTKSIRLSVLLPSTVSYSTTNRIIEIWDANTDGRPGKLIKKGASDHTGKYEADILMAVPTRKIFTRTFAGWRTVALPEPAAGSATETITVDYNIGYGDAPPKPEMTSQGTSGIRVNSIPATHKSGIENRLQNGDFSVHQFGKIDLWSSPIETDSFWYATDAAGSFGSIISEEGNSFARINSVNYSAGGFTQSIQASPGQVVSFSGDARGFDSQQDIYLFLIPRDQSGEPINALSFNLVNPGNTWTNGTVSGSMPEGTVTCQILFYKRSTGIVDFDNAVVSVNEINGDTDQDGIMDSEDIYPDNPARAFDDFYPAMDKPGTFAFEDTWPATDDYDYNDLIVDYQIKRVINGQNQIIEIDMIYQVRAIGSGIKDGFGFQIYISPDLISACESDFEFQHDAILLNENGTEKGQSLATFILFADANTTFTHVQEGSPTINTTLGYYFVVPLEYTFRIFLKEPIDAARVGNDQLNPFLFRTSERSREVHLTGYPPTDLINPQLPGAGDDVSSPASGIYYQTKNGIPWALSLPVQFDYPIEKTDLLKAHLFFASWAAASGTKSQDWYLDQTGYRNWDLVYRW